jgi:bifunctional DNA-binding transcriptional regulator/antitoxin component of YhaV-PrlF toxin-antitoxin module
MTRPTKKSCTVVSTRHRITIPVEVMRMARLSTGDRLDVEGADDGSIVLRRATSPFEEFAGALSDVYPRDHLEELRGQVTKGRRRDG